MHVSFKSKLHLRMKYDTSYSYLSKLYLTTNFTEVSDSPSIVDLTQNGLLQLE